MVTEANLMSRKRDERTDTKYKEDFIMKNLKKIISVTAAAAMVMSTVAPVSVFADDATFKIGGIGPVTGAAAIYGQAVKNATELAINEVNEDGGINGYQVEFKFEDDENDAEKSLNAYNALKDWGMNILVGTVTSTPCVAVANETAADNMFQLTPSGSATECVTNPNVFRVCFSDPNQGTAAAQYIGEHKLATKVAIIYDSSDVYSSGITQNFTAEAANQGIEIVSSEAFTADNNKDFSVQLQKAKDGGAELVFLPIYYTEASLILAQADSMGFETKFFGCDGMDGILGVENFDTSLAEGLMLLTPFAADSTDEKTQNFVKAYKDAYKDTPNQFAADAYDAVYAVKAAAEKEDVKAELKDGYLTVSAETNTRKDEKDEDGKYIRRERYSGSCSRSFYVGDINEADIKGEFKHGILKLTIPKEQPKKEIDTTKYIELD